MTQKSLRAEEEAILISGLPTFSPHLAREMIDSHNGKNGGNTKKKKKHNITEKNEHTQSCGL